MRLGIQALLLEVTFLRSQNLNLKSEKEKLRSDIVEANQRSAIMAQEIDDQNAKLESAGKQRLWEMEQRHSESIRRLNSELSAEKDRVAIQ